MPQDDPGLSPSELMLRAARGEGDFDAPAELDFKLPGNEQVQTGTVESEDASDIGALTAEDIAAELAESSGAGFDNCPTVGAEAPHQRTTDERVAAAHADSAQATVEDPPTPSVPPANSWSEPSSEWIAREAAKPQTRNPVLSGSASWIRIAISAVVLGVIAFGFIGAQIDGKEPVENLAVGDCFVAGQVEEIDQVPVVGCSEVHDSEVMASIEITGLGAPYPGEDQLFDALFDDCVTRFDAYVGEPFEASAYYIDTWIPLLDGWNDGDRTGLCTVVLVDDNFDVVSVTGSARDSVLNA
jgi:hypothetical protein